MACRRKRSISFAWIITCMRSVPTASAPVRPMQCSSPAAKLRKLPCGIMLPVFCWRTIIPGGWPSLPGRTLQPPFCCGMLCALFQSISLTISLLPAMITSQWRSRAFSVQLPGRHFLSAAQRILMISPSMKKNRPEVYCSRSAFFYFFFSSFFRYCPVKEALHSATCSGVPQHTTVPPPSPPSGPRSII